MPGARAVLHADALDDTIAVLNPAEPVCLPATRDGGGRRAGDARPASGRRADRRRRGPAAGIFTERDVLTRVVGARRDPARTSLGDVMTAEPEALTRDHRVAYALHCMSVAGYRTVPLVDAEARPIRRDHRHRRPPVAGQPLPGGDPEPGARRA